MNCKMSQPESQTAVAPSAQSTKSNQQRHSAQNNTAVNWLTPPELLHESFSHQPFTQPFIPPFIHSSTTAAATVATKMDPPVAAKPVGSQQPPSPPISPLTKNSNGDNAVTHDANAATHDVKDPILFPEEPNSPAKPLFERQLSPEAQNVVSGHIEARKATPLPAGVRTPKREDYELVYLFKEVAWTNFFQSPRARQLAWLQRERAQLKMDAKARSGGKAKQVGRLTKEKPLLARPTSLPMTSPSVVESATRPRSASKIVKPAGSRPVRVKSSKACISAAPQPEKKRTTTQADQDFNSIPDYCPPLTTLTSTNVMKIPPVTTSTPREFEKHELHLLPLLHPDEQELACNLRLDPATYLTSKRRIFVARLRHFHEGKIFRKTHAQMACKIDVNKASKLHAAFDSVQWLDDHWMRDLPRPDTET